jgi:hypothetical protein
MLYQEKSGNPGDTSETVERLNGKKDLRQKKMFR